MKVLVTGSSGFIAGYAVKELLEHGYEVIGIDNLSKYGPVPREHDDHERYTFIEGDCKDVALLKNALEDCDHFLAGAAMIGGIGYFHRYAYDLLAENERISAASFDAAIWAYKNRKLKKVTAMSSSMVFECTDVYPSPEEEVRRCPPPLSTYGFQKLACEYFVKGANEQYGLPFTIVRPFNCVGIGEIQPSDGDTIETGNLKMALSHVVPDLVFKLAKGQDPLHLFGKGDQRRHYTYGGDLARGIRVCIEHPAAENEDFNISTPHGHTVLELAEKIWLRMRPNQRFSWVSDEPFEHDVQVRIPDTRKAKRLLGFEATTSLDDILDEVVPWVVKEVEAGNI